MRSSHFPGVACFAIFASLAILPAAHAEPHLSVKPLASGEGAEVRVTPTKAGNNVLLDVLDTAGRCLRTVFAGSISQGQSITIDKRNRLASGSYRLRYREGIKLEFESSLKPPPGEKWINPTDIQLTDQALYILDSGKVPPKKEGQPETPPPDEEDPNNRSTIYKFETDGKPAKFGSRSCIEPFQGATAYRAFAADSEGQIYISATYHAVKVFASNGTPTARTIGGWDNDPHGPKCTVWVHSMALGPNKRIYLPNGYGHVKVYDRTKDAFGGIIGTTQLPGVYIGMDRCITSDMDGAVYIIRGNSGQIERFDDNGKALEPKYLSPSDLKVSFPTGPCASAGLIWVAMHSGAPLWDSDGGEAALFWDNGQSIVLVDRFGMPGTGKEDKVEFLNPSAIAMTPDHNAIWVVEDGLVNGDGPPGNARIRKFRITGSETEETPIEMGAPKPAK
jgi:hypothetical protein